ncbi:MAG: metallopeptidase family protein [Actinomycetia bacterium]|nr:metallopeptidase family protein [Actinomycetes bacterium]
MDLKDFEAEVLEVVENLPLNFQEKIKNIGLVIDDSDIDAEGRLILGLYQGVPATRRAGKKYVFPDKITIYKKAIEKVSRTHQDIKKNIRRVILHEIGHYFGLDDNRLKELGY